MKTFWKAVLPVAVLLLLWQAACNMEIWSQYVLPSPQRVFQSFEAMLRDGTLFRHILVSLWRVLSGFSIAFVLAFLLGILAGVHPASAPFYKHIVEFMRNVPPLSLIALLILWFGIGETSKLIIIVLASFFPMFLNIKKGLAACDVKLLEVGRSLNFSETQLFLKIRLPNALPDILVGMRVGLGYSWRAIIGAEMIAASSGLGYLILDAQQMSRSDKVIVGIFVIGLVGFLCDRLFSYAIQKVLHGGVDDSWS
ncbi:ABC transporter permease [Marasmitruncus massiliensis]|jgi:sulfonate transport system permease protein|uniref:ABC transporter permease n=1 Tax=Marasmitruncus massiliensis TaxID=1944642 RepID=UPI000C7D34F4|nr:ABC transporter permease [Marasmitruncus massiliensis]MBE6905836.1 ABC transporter permease [Oscillospiraceae bacterium]